MINSFDIKVNNIKINNDDINSNKIIWRCLLNYIKGENSCKIMDILTINELKNTILELIWNNIICEFSNITEETKLNIEITGIQCHSNEFILETLVDDENTYTMCFGILPRYNLEPNKRFEQWYKRNIINNKHSNNF